MFLLTLPARAISSTRLPSSPLSANSPIATCRMRSRVSTALRFGLTDRAGTSGGHVIRAQPIRRDAVELERPGVARLGAHLGAHLRNYHAVQIARGGQRHLVVTHILQHTLRL